MVVVSDPGLGKTSTVTSALRKSKQDYYIVTGHVTPLKLFQELYEHKDELIVFDDVDSLLRNPNAIALLKQACDTIPTKRVEYHTTRKMDYPTVFTTKSKTLLLLNRIPNKNSDLEAFLSRGLYVNFVPNPDEIFTELKTFGKDKEIMAYIEAHIKKLSTVNFRVYKHATNLKFGGLDWKAYLDEQLGLLDDEVIAVRITDTRKPYGERVAMWKQLTGKSQSSYDRIVVKLGEEVIVD